MDHRIEQVGRKLRSMMSWLPSKKVPWYQADWYKEQGS